jgi:hypothetical protein
MTGKLVMALPLSYQISVKWFYNWVNMDKTPCVGVVAVEHVQLPKALEMMVDMAFKNYPDWDRLVVMEHDMQPPIDGFKRIQGYDDDLDIVGSIYFRHEPPHNAYVYGPKTWPLKPGYDEVGMISAKDIRVMREKPGLYSCAAVGFGFTSIHRRVLEKWDPEIPMFKFAEPWGSEDLWFCAQAIKQGFNVYVDSAICCGHLTLAPVLYEDNQRFADSSADWDTTTQPRKEE